MKDCGLFFHDSRSSPPPPRRPSQDARRRTDPPFIRISPVLGRAAYTVQHAATLPPLTHIPPRNALRPTFCAMRLLAVTTHDGETVVHRRCWTSNIPFFEPLRIAVISGTDAAAAAECEEVRLRVVAIEWHFLHSIMRMVFPWRICDDAAMTIRNVSNFNHSAQRRTN